MLTITSPAFDHEGMMPSKYTCDGQDINPPLRIAGVPAAAKSLALVMDDPDAPMGTWVHWVIWNIPVSVAIIDEDSVPGGARLGMNTSNKSEYGGPCPPSGVHRYFFKLYALDTMLDLPDSTTREMLEQAMQGHILEEAELMGTYSRG